jgi:hypothetical protein
MQFPIPTRSEFVVEYVHHNLLKFVEECDAIYLPYMQQQISEMEAILKK